MKSLASKIGLGLVISAAVLAPLAGPAAAATETESATAVDQLVPETGSAGVLNALFCSLQTISADVPCKYT
ncbi:hypothetical protein ACWEKT_32730 [Nocardia takedensis]|uniref:hypothetical protein n=1 Tax=Nocardia takedensis TaxID=259390 RepID=UPI0002D4BB1F|nr:hypothetical protein [Nocardia takedensis]